MNLPNKLTVLRVIMVPFFMVAASIRTPIAMLIAGVIFAVASFTDYLDGNIARKYHLVTDFGKFMDPLADKILTTTAFIYMLFDGVCSPIVLTLILAREFAVAGLRMIAAGAPEGKVIAANMWGKVKTVLQMATIIVYYIGVGIEGLTNLGITSNSAYFMQLVSYWLCWAVGIVTLISGAKYLWDNREFINTAK